MYLIHQGIFYSTEGIRWDVRILRDQLLPPDQVGQLRFPADEPLLIEWEERRREEPLCGSTASLRLISPSDRAYIDLYAEAPASIRLDVYRQDSLFWSGTLDPEFYEEPYAFRDSYVVTLMFSDLGVLARLKYTLSGPQSLLDILQDAITRAAISHTAIDQSLISSSIDQQQRATLDAITVQSDNFCDEDGEWLDMAEVLKAILQPLALKLVQRQGNIVIFDLNGLCLQAAATPVRWRSDDQQLSAAPVANRCKVTLSTYATAALIDGSAVHLASSIDEGTINRTNDASGCNSYYPDYEPDWLQTPDAYDNISFSIHYGSQIRLSGISSVGSQAAPFHIVPFFGGQKADGVAWRITSGGHGSLASGFPRLVVGGSPTSLYREVLRMPRVYLPQLSDAAAWMLRLSLPVLFDTRYNPFSSPSQYNEQDNYAAVKAHSAYVFIPVLVQLTDAGGNVIAHFTNAERTVRTDCMGMGHLPGRWVSGLDPMAFQTTGTAPFQGSPYLSALGGNADFGCWLAYYAPEDRHDSDGIQDWHSNRHNIGCSTRPVSDVIQALPDGEYIPYPDRSGWLEVTILSGLVALNDDETWSTWAEGRATWHYDKLRWMLYKAPSVHLVNATPPFAEQAREDIEYSGILNSLAKDDLEIDTICGTADQGIPGARGILMDARSGQQILRLSRAGRTDTAEQLLIGTLHSQYAERRTQLSGTAGIPLGPYPLCTEAMQPGSRFLISSCSADLREDECELTIVEIRPDEYTGR